MTMLLFREVAEAFEKIEATSGRLDMTGLLAGIFAKCTPAEVEQLILLAQGVVAPPFAGIEIGMGERFVIRAIASSTGYDEKNVNAAYKEKGDLGLVAQELLGKKKQSSLVKTELTLKKVFGAFSRIAGTSGTGSQELKIKLLAELLNSATESEGKYLVRMPIGKLRLGVGEPTIIDALSVCRSGTKELREPLERAFSLCSDLGYIGRLFFESPEKIDKFKITLFKPVRPALAERLGSAAEIIEKIGPCGADAKYDGLRLQVHKKGKKVEIFSRKLERIANMFPEIVGATQALKQGELIFEGEALAHDIHNDRYLSFQQTMQRKRKHGVAEMAGSRPLRLFVFDLLYADGKDIGALPFAERREFVEKIFGKPGGQCVGKKEVSTLTATLFKKFDTARELEGFFNKCIASGLEGIIAKELGAAYQPGKRKFAWIKLKRSYGEMADSIDAVVVGYYLGKGSRAEFEFGGLLCAVYNEQTDTLQTIARVGSGFSEDEMGSLREMLDAISIQEKPKGLECKLDADVWVAPKLVVTLVADEITISPMHTCCKEGGRGFALRFPRMAAIREDKGIKEITTSQEIESMFNLQKRTKI
ncbi:DNA ligase [Candidatus Micrarchaeota archaeon CG08_land_8_20_14_0_20_49_17]|nr:MAG: DNA ligase [Candidatus Micrarchaeota archaeon CG08_land_8_20_14_0_20_49_17]PIZ92131.1 MAG: DNA ligase [Candidatus Micrarchaeota archaeon CG_4_10_14_0_2_um_filter_49_7]HII53347.1 ATP-dependent DNA ligase [Candidatus Micrarchaeota archaeon]